MRTTSGLLICKKICQFAIDRLPAVLCGVFALKGAVAVPLHRGDIVIKELRKIKGLTQDELCEGICSISELSRIERGLRRPAWFTFEKLLQRLGEDPHKYYSDIVTIEEKRVIDLKEKIHKCLIQKTDEAFAEARVLLAELERGGGGGAKPPWSGFCGGMEIPVLLPPDAM
jgi:transcriptional regulator with XRE-family HTH domain